MTLSELVSLKLSVQRLAAIEIGQLEAADVRSQIHTLGEHQFAGQLYLANDFIDDSLDKLKVNLVQHYRKLINDIDYSIAKESEQYLLHEYCRTDIDDDRNVKTIMLPESIKQVLIGRIQLRADWHYPGLEISPHDGEFTHHLVGCDPLYLVDVYQEYLDSVKSQFNEQYQARLRVYLTSIGSDTLYLAELPKNQFGTIFSWNAFNYLPMLVITQYLKEAFEILRPGGTFIFGYNDASMVNGAKHVEWGGMRYTTKGMMIRAAKDIGYEISYSYGEDEGWHNISWLEIKKPGELSTVKAHQTLGIVKRIS